MSRPTPQIRDRLAMLGAPFGAGSEALSDTDTEYRLGTSDFIMEYVGRIPYDVTDPARQDLMRATEDANDFILSFRQSSNCFRLTVGGTSRTSDSPAFDIVGHLFHLMVFADRSGDVYFYLDGEALGNSDISGEAATDITSDTVLIGGQMLGTAAGSELTLSSRLFILSGAFPTDGERATIAEDRFLAPDTESLTLSTRSGYATERRIDIDLVDTYADSTTVANHGTGGDFSLSGGLQFDECRVQAEAVRISVPKDNWYTLDENHDAGVTADIGCAVGAYIVEAVYKDITHPGIGDPLFEIQDSTGNERSRINIQSNITVSSQLRIGGVFKTLLVYNASGSEYGRSGLHVLHQLFAPDPDDYYCYVNGNKIGEKTSIGSDLDLSGALTIDFGHSSLRDGLVALRVWNLAGASAPLPDNYVEEIYARVRDPWSTEGAFSSMTLRGNWELRESAQLPGSTTITNLANPGTGDLTVSGGDTFGDARYLIVRQGL